MQLLSAPKLHGVPTCMHDKLLTAQRCAGARCALLFVLGCLQPLKLLQNAWFNLHSSS